MPNLGLIKKLRETVGCGIADCNKALKECGDNYDEAVAWLRKKGLSSAAKKSERITTEGLVCVYQSGKKACLIELNSETDFVSRNDKFQKLATQITETAIDVASTTLADKYIDTLKNMNAKGTSKKVSELLTESISVIGENLNLRRGKTVELKEDGMIVSYLHNKAAEGLGKIGVLLVLNSTGDKTKLAELGKKISMHIAAAKPECLDVEGVSQENLKKEKEILFEQAKQSGKPENIIEKMMEGRIRKYYERVVLLEQLFVMDDKKKVKKVLEEFEKENGAPVKIQEYIMFVLGEGLEKKEDDFAKEVEAMRK